MSTTIIRADYRTMAVDVLTRHGSDPAGVVRPAAEPMFFVHSVTLTDTDTDEATPVALRNPYLTADDLNNILTEAADAYADERGLLAKGLGDDCWELIHP